MASHRPYQPRKYDVGRRLLGLRTRANLTQTDLAKWVGVNRRSVQNWETGAGYPREQRLEQLVAVFVRHHAFTPGQERAEAESLWAQVTADAPHPYATFDAQWFETLLIEGRYAGENLPPPQPQAIAQPALSQVDWGEEVDVAILYGRDIQLARLTQWSKDDRCRLIGVLGLAGIGKTSLAITFAQQSTPLFDAVIFRSLRNAPPLSEVVDALIRIISQQQATPPDRPPDKIELLIRLCRERRCLVVLDNFESILQEGANAGDYNRGHEGYGLLLKRVGETNHRSCFVLTSREKPAELGLYESSTGPVRTLVLEGLDAAASKMILAEKDIQTAEPAYSALTRLYGGNPLALKLVSEPIREVFGGDVHTFLAQGEPFFNGVGKLLEEEFARSSPLEQSLLYALAIDRELTTLMSLESDRHDAPPRQILQALESLRRRLLIERSSDRPAFTLQPVIMEYVTDRLVETVTREISARQPALLHQHALVQATAKDYLRWAQERLIAQPVLDGLSAQGRATKTEQRLLELLGDWRGQPSADQGCGPGNVVNLLRLLRGDLRAVDLSSLAIEQAYLQETEMQDARLDHALLSHSVLAEAFDYGVCVALSGDGEYLAAGTASGETRMWRVADRMPLLYAGEHSGGIYGIAITPDGQLVATGSVDGTVKLWSASRNESLATLRGHTGVVHGVALDANGKRVASAGFDGTVRLWQVDSAQPMRTLTGHEGLVWSVALSANGRLVASGGTDGTVRFWDAETGAPLAIWQDDSAGVWSVALSADQRLVASGGYDGRVRIRDTQSGKIVSVLRGHSDMVWGVGFSGDGRLVASGSYDGTVRIWDASSGTCRATLAGHRGGIRGVAMSTGGRLLASTSFDGTIRLWQAESGQPLTLLQGQTGLIWAAALSGDGQILASGGMDARVRLWNTANGQLLASLEGHEGQVISVALSRDGRFAASGGRDGTIRLWDVENQSLVSTFRGHAGSVWSVALNSDGSILTSGGYDETVRLWDTRSRQLVKTFTGHKGTVHSVALTADGERVVSGGRDGTVRLWDAAHGNSQVVLQAHTGPVWGLALSGDGQVLASGSEDGTIRLWHMQDGSLFTTLHGHNGAVFAVGLDHEGRRAASTGMDGMIRFWSLPEGIELYTVRAHQGAIWGMAMSADGRLVAGGVRGGTVQLWDARTGSATGSLRPDRLYERMDITGIHGLTKAQKAGLRSLGAVDMMK